MATGDWTQAEVDAAISDYFEMLIHELRREPYSKAAHNRGLQASIARSRGSIERKHSNISAVLLDLGYPFIEGYKPQSHYQRLLGDAVINRLASDTGLTALVRESADEPADPTTVSDYLVRMEAPPEPTGSPGYPASARESDAIQRNRPPVNYLEREAANASLGRAGELFVLEFERARLLAAGRDGLLERVEHVAETQGDGVGFDVRSFEEDGSDRLIEVKTTAYGKETPFFVSRNEIFVSRRRSGVFALYRVFDFRRNPRLFALPGAIDSTCRLEAVQFSARVG